MGVMSRKVVPACGNLCIFCPSMRARSRQPVKRYKKLLADIFPRSQDTEPNDRKIGKLCEYAAKNPLRLPKITETLEQKIYKQLRNEQFVAVKIVLRIYGKLLSSCKEQMPLFASSLLGIVRTLLEQTSQAEIQILGCSALVDLINSQKDSTYIFNMEGLIPKLCQLAQEIGDDERALFLRSAGLQALACMVKFMGEQSHISVEFDHIISVTLENYMDLTIKPEDVKQDVSIVKSSKAEVVPEMDASKSPSYWSRVCLHNIAQLAKEATTVRRVLEPLFHCFDTGSDWSLEKGHACSVLMHVQMLLDDSGDSFHLLLSMLVKHLDHKEVSKQPHLQIDILNVASRLSQNVKQQPSIAIIGAIADLIKHLRKCIQFSAESTNHADGSDKWNTDLLLALENCISQLSSKVGDVGPIFDMMAVVLENIPTNAPLARATIFAVYRTAQVVCSLPNISYVTKAFPDALFHHLLLAMSHPDNETRVGAHGIFSIVLMPSLVFPLSVNNGTLTDLEQVMSMKAPACLRLSSHQVSLLLSAIWIQATSFENTPATFVAMAQTFNIALLFTLWKNSSYVALVRCFQLAFSLRRISLDHEGVLQLYHKRSLFTLASCMIIFSARASNLPELIPIVKSTLTEETGDPFLELVGDIKLQVRDVHPPTQEKYYGSPDDEAAAVKSLSVIDLDDQKLKENVLTHLRTKFGKLSEEDLSSMKMQLLQGFVPDESYPLGGPLFMETPRPFSPLAQMEFLSFDEVMPSAALMDDDTFPDPQGNQSGRRTSFSIDSLCILNVNQLLDSVLETARHVASLPISSTPIPYDEMRNQCEALVSGKQQKMSILQSFKFREEAKAMLLSSEHEKRSEILQKPIMGQSEVELNLLPNLKQAEKHDQLVLCSSEYGKQQSFRLPPSSPYDKFLKAAGC